MCSYPVRKLTESPSRNRWKLHKICYNSSVLHKGTACDSGPLRTLWISYTKHKNTLYNPWHIITRDMHESEKQRIRVVCGLLTKHPWTLEKRQQPGFSSGTRAAVSAQAPAYQLGSFHRKCRYSWIMMSHKPSQTTIPTPISCPSLCDSPPLSFSRAMLCTVKSL